MKLLAINYRTRCRNVRFPRHVKLTFGMPNTITSLTSTPLFVWKALTKSRFRRSGLALCGLLSISALLLRKKYRGRVINVSADQDVEDFTVNQQAMLRRVREIWQEHCARAESNGVNWLRP